ncbi:MAG: nickel pincer cofactor biosynthesis protein LarB [Ruminococcaceae bacterium]|nr:nickel pincer cofactor biosynthesis protein LarB [Oscillospiraceae bacterium]
MNKDELKTMLEQVSKGELSVDEAVTRIKLQPYDDLDFAKIDTHRGIRQGADEVIYSEGKTAEQICKIVKHILENSSESVLITRLSEDKAETLGKEIKLFYDKASRIGIAGDKPANKNVGNIVVATGGTSDIPVAEEAALTAEFYGNKVTRLYDVGVSGVHRLIGNAEVLADARVVIAIAGMEGALASVIGGMTDCPVIAVPTSVGYGANFRGLSALLSMLNSCASGVSVVNIDNGFGAGYIANMINKQGI